jgi:FAD binding domain
MFHHLSSFAAALPAAFNTLAQTATPEIPENIARSHAQDVLNNGSPQTECERACASIGDLLPRALYLGVKGDFNAHSCDAKQSDLIPACRVEPSSPQDVSSILKIILKEQCHFVIRGGGHSRIAGSSNVQGGVAIDLTRMKGIEIGPDKQSVCIGAGAVWGDV